MSFHQKSVMELRSGVEKRCSGGEVEDHLSRDFPGLSISTFATISCTSGSRLRLFNHPVGSAEQREWRLNPKRVGAFKI
jgi:hypothetical protein